ncbi:barstar family protein [Gordonia amicalis]|uniref:Barstar family protein n=1 Tax=Gordonia amicalis TaxID=89053 RepID=A0AAE4R6A6_9ACTN|nr:MULTISPECIES: barstar family protein [Gordonia]MCZ4581761.1 barstar family protein [Gordonia amicalis]MCZ4650173.1 barstar family protein [Gordonia amicalis]MDV6313859.1 barstar family protein [Gordonia amicalis]MDV7102380.1 barstar family protein [Gordonia amicalis]UPW12940.1 barstar family protein [Gordonia amicalis]
MTARDGLGARLRRFLDDAGREGSAVGLTIEPELPDLGPDTRLRTVSGTAATTTGALFTAFARVWDFPDHFGRNRDAFDDCMRDLDAPDAGGRTPSIIVSHVTRADRLLEQDDAAFEWFADSIGFYRDHYRDAGKTFALILSAAPSRSSAVRARWDAAGVAVAELDNRREG